MEDTCYRKKQRGMPYIANDVFLDRETQQLIMTRVHVRGNILRQTALIVLLAQMGVLFLQIVSGWELSIRYSPGCQR
jgi:DNA mismatch repair ATPase MutS